MKKIKELILNAFIYMKANIQMRAAIRAVESIHKKNKKIRFNERENRQYLVLLSIPYFTKKGTFKYKERLYWVNRKNFRILKYKGWVKRGVNFAELRNKAFYVSDPDRSYENEYIAKKAAINKYKTYLKSNLQ
ncbi:MAG TPA: hypothetical protein PK285_11180 [Bacteroidales bacterium]|jgi:hypothetical protein|nr:hypothetical protein [Bacteroidales bacterium]